MHQRKAPFISSEGHIIAGFLKAPGRTMVCVHWKLLQSESRTFQFGSLETFSQLLGAASKGRWEMLKAEPYGYDDLVDYRDDDWPEQSKKSAGEIHYAYDCISEGDTVQRIASMLTKNGKCAIVRSREGGAWKSGDLPVEPSYGAVWEGLGEEVQYQGFTVKQSPAALGFAVAFYKWLSVALGSELKPSPIRLMPGGLDKVVGDGFQLLGAGGMEGREAKRTEEWMRPVSAEKLVYRI